MGIELRRDALYVVFKLSYSAGRHSTPPFIRHIAAGENNGHAPGIIIFNLVLDVSDEHQCELETTRTNVVNVCVENPTAYCTGSRSCGKRVIDGRHDK